MISKISSFGVSKISFGKLKISEDKETKKAMRNLRKTDHVIMGALSNVDNESERVGYDVNFSAKMLADKSVFFQAYAYDKKNNKFVGYHCDVLKNIDKEASEPKIHADNKDRSSRFAYDFPREVQKTMEEEGDNE